MVGLQRRKIPNGIGGAGRSVAPPMALLEDRGEPSEAEELGGEDDGADVGVVVLFVGADSAVGVGLLTPPARPMNRPSGSHALDCKGFPLATRLAAAPTANIVTGAAEAPNTADVKADMTLQNLLREMGNVVTIKIDS